MRGSLGAVVLVCLAAGCGDQAATSGSGSASASAKPSGSAKTAATSAEAKPAETASAKPERKAKTKLTEKQMQEAYDEIKKVPDFKKHREALEAKLGKPMKEDGDQAYWWGIKSGDGGKETCFQLSASPTKGNGTQGADDTNCWE